MQTTVMYWPVELVAPVGWRYHCALAGNHGRYSYLIRRTWVGAAINPRPVPGLPFKLLGRFEIGGKFRG